ncbi:MAG: hypothetical protein JWM90_537 [Thermoleophilia bacterium]|nr:hypothetical protein [Thermoleophilia bacterium]
MQIAIAATPQRIALTQAYDSFNDAYNALVVDQDITTDASITASRAHATAGVELLLSAGPGSVPADNVAFCVDVARAGVAALDAALAAASTGTRDAAVNAALNSFDTVAERLSNDLDLGVG